MEAIEREIDTIVFDVYGLSAPERKLVLDWLGERRESPGRRNARGLAEAQRATGDCGRVERVASTADELIKDILRQSAYRHTARAEALTAVKVSGGYRLDNPSLPWQ